MEYPECPVNHAIMWKRLENYYVIECAPLSWDEIQEKMYVDALVKGAYYIPMIIILLICCSCMFSGRRIYRIRKDSGGETIVNI
jgi:hypothetical protein